MWLWGHRTQAGQQDRVMGTQAGQQDVALGALTCVDAMAELGSATGIAVPSSAGAQEQPWGWRSVGITAGTGTAVLGRLQRAAGKQGEDGASPPHPPAQETTLTREQRKKVTQHRGQDAQLEQQEWHSWNSQNSTAPDSSSLLPTASPYNHFHFCKSTFSRREPRLCHIVLCQGLHFQEPPFPGTGPGLQQSILAKISFPALQTPQLLQGGQPCLRNHSHEHTQPLWGTREAKDSCPRPAWKSSAFPGRAGRSRGSQLRGAPGCPVPGKQQEPRDLPT